MTDQRYRTPAAFKQALEQRLRNMTMAREDQLTWSTLDDVTKAAQTFFNPVLADDLDAAWNPDIWEWRG